MNQNQKGYALLAMTVVLAAVAAVFLIQGMGATLSSNARDEQRRSLQAMKDAKMALIAKSIADTVVENTTPGSLLYPDGKNSGSSNNEGYSINNPIMLGCLPWKELGLEPAENQGITPLYYALSPYFNNQYTSTQRANSSNGSAKVNLDNFGALTLQTETSTTTIIAAIIAPGPSLENQHRPASSANPCDPAQATQFLESINTPLSTIIHNRQNAATSIGTFNDLILPITRNSLFKPLLPIILQPFATDKSTPTKGVRWFLNERGIAASDLNLNGKLNRTPFMEEANNNAVTTAEFQCPSMSGTQTCFDRLFDPQASIKSKGGLTAANISVCNTITPSTGGTSGKAPASWLCANDWYSNIVYQSDSSGSATLSLSLPFGNNTYKCILDIDKPADLKNPNCK